MIIEKDVIEVYRLGLIIGYYSVDELINWADYIIEIEKQPGDEIIDISLSKKKGINIIIEKLNQIEYEQKWDIPPKILLGLFYKDLANNQKSIEYLKSFAKQLYELSLQISDANVGSDVIYGINTAEDHLEIALDHLDSNITIRSFLSRFEDLLKPFLIYAIEYENSIYFKR